MDLTKATRSVELEAGSFPVVDVGEGPAVVLLHGFPDSRHLWRHQIPVLVDAGFRVLAPDLRGFGDAPRPTDVHSYRWPHLVADFLGLLDRSGIETAHVVGHDWGAALAWRLASWQPSRVNRLVAVSVGAPASPGWDRIEQHEKSWYFDFFVKTGRAESKLMAKDWELFRAWTHDQGDVERYLADLGRPGALTAGLNWYRAAFSQPTAEEPPLARMPDWAPTTQPTLGIWGEHDPFLVEPQIAESGKVVAGPWRYERLTGAGHWLMLDRPAVVNELLVDFLSRAVSSPASGPN